MAGGFGMIDEHLRDKRILLVDDEHDLARMVATILRAIGVRAVDVVHAGAEALAAGRRRATCPSAVPPARPRRMMPGMDGFDLLARIRERPAYAPMPAVFLTAKDDPTDRVTGLALGADDDVAKPFLPQELVLRIAAVLRRCYAQESPTLELDASAWTSTPPRWAARTGRPWSSPPRSTRY